MVMEQDRHQYASGVAGPPSHDFATKSSGGSAGEKTPGESDEEGPERPGSAPPTLDLTSKSLFAFTAQPKFYSPELLFHDQYQEESYSSYNYVEEKAEEPDYAPSDVTFFEESPRPSQDEEGAGRGGRFSIGSQTGLPMQPRQRKHSIEMFLAQSPSHTLGEPFMKMNFEDELSPSPSPSPVQHPAHQRTQAKPQRNYRSIHGYTQNGGPMGVGTEPVSGRGGPGWGQPPPPSGPRSSQAPTNLRQSQSHPARPVTAKELGMTPHGQQPSHTQQLQGKMNSLPHRTAPNELSAEQVHPMYRTSQTAESQTAQEGGVPGIVPTAALPYYIPGFGDGNVALYPAGLMAGQLQPMMPGAYPHLVHPQMMLPGVMHWAVPLVPPQAQLHPLQPYAGYPSPSPPMMSGGAGYEGPAQSPKQGTLKGGIKYYGGQRQKGGDGADDTRGEKGPLRRRRSERESLMTHEHFSADVSLTDIKSRIFQMSKDQNGCRLLQELLEQGKTDFRDLIFEESVDHLTEMMVDPFGNYLFQKLIEKISDRQRTEIIERVGGNLVAAALNLHGTRSVQKVVEVCSQPEQVQHIIKALRQQAVRLCIDSNGNHVIQRVLNTLKPKDNNFVFEAVAESCVVVGTHRHGCCVLQRCLDAADPRQKALIISKVEEHAMQLMQDPFGNYVVQYVLDTCTPQEAAGVILKPIGHIAHLSVQKFSSNVIEKCLEKASEPVKALYLQEISAKENIKHLLQDQYANYVVQRALSVASYEQGMVLVNAIKKHLPTMKNTSGGRRISTRILKRFPNVDLEVGDKESSQPTSESSRQSSPLSLSPYSETKASFESPSGE